MSEIFVESMSFLNDCITQVLGGYSSAISSYFIEKNHFYSRCTEGEQDVSMLACFWYLDFLDSQAKLVKICDALSFDRARTVKLFWLLWKWEEAHPGQEFPLEYHLEAMKRYLIKEPLLQKARSIEHFPIRSKDLSAADCFLNLYTYPETRCLCIFACCPCADGYTVPGLELTRQASELTEGYIALQDDGGTWGVLPSLIAAGIVTEVVKYESWGPISVPICRYDKTALARFTHINRSYLDLHGLRTDLP